MKFDLHMNVTQTSKALAQANPELAWGTTYPDRIYDFNGTQVPQGNPMEVGEALHFNLHKLINDLWVPREYYNATASILEVLEDLGIEQVDTEKRIVRGGIHGQCDLHGIDLRRNHWVFEIKTTRGRHVEPPRPNEMIQMALYASMLKLDSPRLACIRINLATSKIGVYVRYDSQQLIDWASMQLDVA